MDMNKIEAIKAVLEGRRVRKIGWAEDLYIYLNHNNFFRTSRDEYYDFNCTNVERWEIYEEPKKLVKKKFVRWVNYYPETPGQLGEIYVSEETARNCKGYSVGETHKIEFEIEVEE